MPSKEPNGESRSRGMRDPEFPYNQRNIMRLDLAAGNDIFQAATGTGDHRQVVAEMDGPIIGPEVPSEDECEQLLKDGGSRSAWVLDPDKNDGDPFRQKFSGFQAIYIAKIMHEGEKLRGAWKTKKITEEQVREMWSGFTIGFKLGTTTKVVEVNMKELKGKSAEEIGEILKAAGVKIS